MPIKYFFFLYEKKNNTYKQAKTVTIR